MRIWPNKTIFKKIYFFTLLENSYRPIHGSHFFTQSLLFLKLKKGQIEARDLARTHLHHAVLSHDEVRQCRTTVSLTPGEKCYFSGLAMSISNCILLTIDRYKFWTHFQHF
jgi:hypothetical protein